MSPREQNCSQLKLCIHALLGSKIPQDGPSACPAPALPAKLPHHPIGPSACQILLPGWMLKQATRGTVFPQAISPARYPPPGLSHGCSIRKLVVSTHLCSHSIANQRSEPESCNPVPLPNWSCSPPPCHRFGESSPSSPLPAYHPDLLKHNTVGSVACWGRIHDFSMSQC